MAVQSLFHSVRSLALLALLALLAAIPAVTLAGCAQGSSGNVDGSITGLPDADPNAPDADPNAPDANMSLADATVGAPDARPNNAPDASSTCPKTPCHLVDQCGCTPPAVCDLDSTSGTALAAGDTRCRAVLSPGRELASCATNDECAGGYMCIGQPTSQCRKWCDPANDLCGGPGGKCIIQITYNGADIPGAITCSKDCDPTAATPSGCPATFGCHVSLTDPDSSLPTVSGDEVLYTDCAPQATLGGDGASCATNGHADCKAGYDCVNIGTTPVCKQNCIVSGGTGPACAVGTCGGFNPPATVGTITYGICN